MIINLESSRYHKVLMPIIECLKFSPLSQELTMVEPVPLIQLSKAYSSTIYTKADEIIHLMLSWIQSQFPTSSSSRGSIRWDLLLTSLYCESSGSSFFFLCGMGYSLSCSRAFLKAFQGHTVQVSYSIL